MKVDKEGNVNLELIKPEEEKKYAEVAKDLNP